MVKLQFKKNRIRYKRKTYEYERVTLNFPMENNQTLQPLRDKELKIKVTNKNGTYNVSMADKNA